MEVGFIVGTLGRGGAERQLIYMLRALQQAGVETRVLCLTRGEALEVVIKGLGIEVEWVGSSKSRIVRILTIANNIRKRPVDILQSSHFYTNIYAGAVGRLLGIPSVGAVRNDLVSEIAANGSFGRWQLSLPRLLIANSKSAVSRSATLGVMPQKIHYVRNVVEVEDVEEGAGRIEKENIHILFAGRLVPQKNPEMFVRLAARLVNDLPDRRLTFEVAGDGPLRGRLELLVAESNLSPEQFCFSGTASNIDDVYRRSDIVVLSSDHEGTPNVILEAMAHGIPVVATSVGGVPEILDRECGCLVQPSDLEALVLASKKLIGDRSLRNRMGDNGIRFVCANHSPAYLAKRLMGIYAKLAGDRRNA